MSITVRTLLTLATLAMSLPAVSMATTIMPTSYSYTGGTPSGEPGYSLYTDPGMTKLTNGDTGTTATVDGTWVGWQNSDSGAANITFNFASSVTITDVALDFLRSDYANTQLPESVTVGTTNFPTTNFVVDPQQGFVNYSGSWTGSSLTVTLNHPTSHWVFINEAQFTVADQSSAPEPASLTLVSLALGGLIFGRKRLCRS